MIEKIDEIRHWIAIKLGLARSNEKQDHEKAKIEERKLSELWAVADQDLKKAIEEKRIFVSREIDSMRLFGDIRGGVNYQVRPSLTTKSLFPKGMKPTKSDSDREHEAQTDRPRATGFFGDRPTIQRNNTASVNLPASDAKKGKVKSASDLSDTRRPTGIFANRSNPALETHQDRTETAQADKGANAAEIERRKQAAKAVVRARLQRERQRDRSYDMGR
jgi:hypothetical protein